MKKVLNKFIITSISISVLFLIVGIILMIYPEISLTTLSYVIGFSFIISGIFFMIESSNKLLFMNFITFGMLQIIAGYVFLVYPELIKTLLPILIGIWMVVKSTIDCNFSLMLKKYSNENWFYLLALSILSIVCGFIIILNPQISSLAIITAIGAIIIVYSIANIANAIIIKNNAKKILNYFDVK